MKYCENYAALLDAFVDGELPAQEADAIRAHLADCPGCQAYVQGALAIRDAFPHPEDTVLPVDFTETVMTAVRAAKLPPLPKAATATPAPRWKKLLLPLAACCAVVVLVQALPGLSRPVAPAAPPQEIAQESGQTPETETVTPPAAESAPTPFAATPPALEPVSEPAAEDTNAKNTAPTHFGVGDSPVGIAEIAPRSVLPDEGDTPFITLTLTAEEAALLPAEAAAQTEEGLVYYHLSVQAYNDLLAALAELERANLPAPADATQEGYALIYVSAP